MANPKRIIRRKLAVSYLSKLSLLALLATGVSGCYQEETTAIFSKEKALAKQYDGRSLASIRNDDYRPIQTKGLISEELREFYQNASSHNDSYNLDKLIKELVESGLVDSYIVKDIDVIEGDLFSAKNKDGQQVTVRMLGIDAPNKKADFYKQSSISLSKCIGAKKEATLLIPKKHPIDNLGRVTAQVVVGDKICNLEQLNNGMAWFYKPMVRHQFDFEISTFNIAESNAKLAKIGIWSRGNYGFQKPWLGRENGGSPYL